jgi:REP element-mobilizing transposase RayT
MYPPKLRLSELVNSLKALPAKAERGVPHDKAVCADALWTLSYHVGSACGALVEVVRRYIEEQCRPA